MKLSILIPVYNQLHFTKQVIQSIKDNIFLDDYEIIILNNWSNDWTYEYLKELEWPIYSINLKKNIYVNPSWNLLAEDAMWEYLLFLNNDITLFKNFDIKLLSYHEDGKITCPYTKQYWDESPPFYQKSNINWTCFLVKKEDYTRIPSKLTTWWWDDYLYRTLWVKWIQEPVIHWWSQTLNKLPELQKIIDSDRQIWIDICKKKWWEDKRFPETLKQ